MKEFTYFKDSGLSDDACRWLDIMGMEETRWILDTKWITSHCDLTYREWRDS